uniref:Uncharacterized protein n=1 Tax=Ralstonia solanacearum TaxID=305 RepID=A0A0S4TYV4_RALSL|nr:conserved protein of unknown function [Ralstonia solanacearum]
MPQAYTDVSVRIEGDDEIHATDPRGCAPLLGISTQQVTLKIKVAGISPCKMRGDTRTHANRSP